MHYRLIASAAAIVGTSTVSRAASLSSVAPATIESDVHVFVVEENGSVTKDDETTWRANTAAGIDDIAQRHVWYEDCKDPMALYGALLAAVGIRSEAALIGPGLVHTLPAVPGHGASAINHAITWLPDLNTHETAQIALPNDVRMTDVPDDVEIKDRFFDFRSRYVFDPATNVIHVMRHLSATFGAQACSPNDFAAVRPTLQKIERDAQSQVIVKANRG